MSSAVQADWWSRGACRSVDPDLFFPITSVGPAAGQIAQAKAVCAACRVRSQCLSYALEADPLHGIWGGTTEQERSILRKRRDDIRVAILTGQRRRSQSRHGQRWPSR